jgi:hypothetical protein
MLIFIVTELLLDVKNNLNKTDILAIWIVDFEYSLSNKIIFWKNNNEILNSNIENLWK